jgi:alkanesulfonate monooxygenase SsuD/methylene tetrahydromethanopterin reductase-like flavin-dependent oxidoreductase (luciferase family)
MKFGFCYIPNRVPVVNGDAAAWYGQLMAQWTTADRLGFDMVMIAEHRYGGYGFSSPPVVAQAIASATRRIRVGTAVALIGHRHPIHSAEHWAAVDLLSGGRLDFGIGRGIWPYDMDVMGIAHDTSRARFEEAWQAVRRLWTEDDVTHEGTFWQFEHHTLFPKPLQRPHPPVYVGCNATPESYEWAGRNGFHILTSPFLLKSTALQRELLDRYREALAGAGHDPARFDVLGNYHLFIGESEAAVAEARTYILNYLGFIRATSSKARLQGDDYRVYRETDAMRSDVDDMLANRAITGTPARCRERIAELAEACGLSGWIFHINYGGVPHTRVLDQMELFAAEVLPAFRTAAVAATGRA